MESNSNNINDYSKNEPNLNDNENLSNPFKNDFNQEENNNKEQDNQNNNLNDYSNPFKDELNENENDNNQNNNNQNEEKYNNQTNKEENFNNINNNEEKQSFINQNDENINNINNKEEEYKNINNINEQNNIYNINSQNINNENFNNQNNIDENYNNDFANPFANEFNDDNSDNDNSNFNLINNNNLNNNNNNNSNYFNPYSNSNSNNNINPFEDNINNNPFVSNFGQSNFNFNSKQNNNFNKLNYSKELAVNNNNNQNNYNNNNNQNNYNNNNNQNNYNNNNNQNNYNNNNQNNYNNNNNHNNYNHNKQNNYNNNNRQNNYNNNNNHNYYNNNNNNNNNNSNYNNNIKNNTFNPNNNNINNQNNNLNQKGNNINNKTPNPNNSLEKNTKNAKTPTPTNTPKNNSQELSKENDIKKIQAIIVRCESMVGEAKKQFDLFEIREAISILCKAIKGLDSVKNTINTQKQHCSSLLPSIKELRDKSFSILQEYRIMVYKIIPIRFKIIPYKPYEDQKESLIQYCSKYILNKPFISYDDIYENDSLDYTKTVKFTLKNNLSEAQKTGNKCFLIYGPKGCGKTLYIHAIANQLGARIVQIESNEVFKIQNFSREFIKACFTNMQFKPLIIFMKNIEQIINNQFNFNNFNYIYDRVASSYELNVYFFATSSINVYNIPRSIADKFQFYQCVKPILKEHKGEYIKFIGKKIGIEIKVNDKELNNLAVENLHYFSNRDIFDLIKNAIDIKKQNSPPNDENWVYKEGLNEEDIKKAFTNIKGTLTDDVLKSYYL